MGTSPAFVYDDSKISLAAALMDKHGVTALPVMQRGGQATGILDAAGVLRAYNMHRHQNEPMQRVISVKRRAYKMWINQKGRTQ
ncbi:hypothetical protein MKQ70_16200 [Chitinophaga sedimenti]|uniref:CBS domain-containing protein n=1 Tax=Chitinophaga sedimenti TaxID=2033606 RepID=UPI0020046071|nr:CBS domain-containing protein [Chitinophaga sedimenti]MCK7556473.1 hypothetical protein [Chitinophaga sedimenti]